MEKHRGAYSGLFSALWLHVIKVKAEVLIKRVLNSADIMIMVVDQPQQGTESREVVGIIHSLVEIAHAGYEERAQAGPVDRGRNHSCRKVEHEIRIEP